LLCVFAGVLALVDRRRRLPWTLGLVILVALAWVACGGGDSGNGSGSTPVPTTGTVVAWQFNRSDLGAGMIQVFRRPGVSASSAQFKLNGLDSTVTYALTDLDTQVQTTMSGSDLLNKGISITLPSAPGSSLIVYKHSP
jgi:hypothetical protein